MNLAHQHKIKPMKTWKDAAIKATEDSNLVQQIEMILFEHTNKNTMDIAFKVLDWHKEELLRQKKEIEELIEKEKKYSSGYCPYQPCKKSGSLGSFSLEHPTDAIERVGFYNQALDDILKLLRE